MPDMDMDLGKSIAIGDSLSLDKNAFTGNTFGIGVGWEPAVAGKTIDCDIWGVELTADGKFTGNILDVGFYKVPGKKEYTYNTSKSVFAAEKDNLDGVDDPNLKDDEFLRVYLDKVPATSAGVAVCLNIFDGKKKGQKFGDIKKLYLRLVTGDDQDGEPVAGLRLNPSQLAPDATAMEYVRFMREGSGWKYVPRGEVLGDAEQGSRINTAAPFLKAA